VPVALQRNRMGGQTNSVLTITNVQIADAGYISCLVATPRQIEETSSASLEVFTAAPTARCARSRWLSQHCCLRRADRQHWKPRHMPGEIQRLCQLYLFPTNFWGWTPSTNTTVYTATDTSRTNTKVEYVGGYGDSGCAKDHGDDSLSNV